MNKWIVYFTIFYVIVAVLFNRNLDYIKKFFRNKILAHVSDDGLISIEQLKIFNGIDNDKLYLAILGEVFDVSSARQKYGPGEAYHFFTGKDGSRNFINGLFNDKDASDKIHDLNAEDLISLENWLKFYKKEYPKIGKLIGTYYDDKGKLTPYGSTMKDLIQQAHETKAQKAEQDEKLPPCNIEWSADKGTHVWCTKKSGGITRNWVGFPREYYEPGSQHNKCVCVNENDLTNPNVKMYEGCESDSIECYVNN